MLRTAILITCILAAPALAAPALAAPAAQPEAGSGMARGKVSMQDLHFSSKAEAAAACDKAPVSSAADGSFTCSVPASSSMAINEKGLPNNKSKPASKP